MKDAGPRFPSFELVERQMQPARALPQRRGTRVFGASAAAIAVAVALFWFGILASPQPTRAGMDPATIDPEALVANTLTNLPPFEERYQRHIGILDKLEAR